MTGAIRLMKTKTFYTLYGDVFVWVCSGFSIILLGYALFRHRTPGLPNQRSSPDRR
jgi:apolipoprotein N-acyltransferase